MKRGESLADMRCWRRPDPADRDSFAAILKRRSRLLAVCLQDRRDGVQE